MSRVKSPLEKIVEEIDALPDTNSLSDTDYEAWLSIKNTLDKIGTLYDGLPDVKKTQVQNYDYYLNYFSSFNSRYAAVLSGYQQSIKTGTIINFEDKQTATIETVNCVDNVKWGIANNYSKDAVNPSDTAIKITGNSKTNSASSSLGLYMLNRDLVSGEAKAINTFRAKILLTSSNTLPVMIYEYQDPNNWSGIGINLSNGTIGMTGIAAKSDENGCTIKKTKNYPTGQAVVGADFHYSGTELWADVVLRYTTTTVSVIINTSEGLVRPNNLAIPLTMPPITRVGFTCFSNTAVNYIDDISVTFAKSEQVIVADSFLKRYKELLNIRASTISDTDNDTLTEAVNKYNSLSETEKFALPLIKEQLGELQAAMQETLGTGNSLSDKLVPDNYWENHTSYTLSEDFESPTSLGRFVDYDAQQFDRVSYGENPKIDYNEDMQSNALLLHKVTLAVKEDFLPEKAQLSHVSFDALLKKDAKELRSSNALRLYMWFYDYQTNAYFDIFSDSQDFSTRGNACVKYIVKGGKGAGGIYRDNMFDITKPIHFDFEYLNKKVFVKLSQTYFNGTGDEVTTFEAVFSCPFDSSFFLLSGDNFTYLDNIELTYLKGDYDIDEEVSDISVIYSGNTFQHPGDTINLSGENLGINVSSVKIARIDDAEVLFANAGYINTFKPDFGGVKNGTYSENPIEPVWKNEWNDEAYNVPILQTTVESVKFKIPSSYQAGIYAVKLYGNDFLSDEDDVVIYLNTPYIDYAVGDQGEKVTEGGTLQVVGKNISPDYTEGEPITAKAVIKGNGYLKEANIIQIKSDYSIVIDIPDDVEINKTYELWIYNGFGDDSCWSIPTTFTVTEDIRSGWSDAFFNLQTDFGATGKKEENATGIMVKALQALYEAGGGTLYLPRGIYRLEQALIIPENVIITGESQSETIILYTPYRWQNGELPSFVLSITKNVEISNISFYGTRINGFIQINNLKQADGNVLSENVYLTNIYVEWSPYSGGPWGVYNNISPLIGPEADGAIEQITAIEAEMLSNRQYFFRKTVDTADFTNVQITDVVYRSFGYQHGIWTAFGPPANCRYWQIRNYTEKSQWSSIQLDKSIVEGFSHSNSCACLWGNGLYVSDSEWTDSMTNNRELAVADKTSMASNFVITKVDDGGKDITYTLPLNVSVDFMRGSEIFVATGNGAGQTRTIVSARRVSNSVAEVTFESPFTLPINRNSLCVLGSVRENQYFVNNYFANGSTAIGFYGRCIDTVMDGNILDRVGTPYMQARTDEKCWYISYINNQHINGSFMQRGTGGEDGTEYTYYFVYSSGANGVRAFTYRDNDFGDHGLHIRTTSVPGGAVRDFIIERNMFSDRDDAIYFSGDVSAMDGVYICDNVFTDIAVKYTENVLKGTLLMNQTGAKRVIIANTEGKACKGDVNLDGKVSLKDITYIRYYLIGKIDLSDIQMQNGDIDNDNSLTIMDAVLLRNTLLSN